MKKFPIVLLVGTLLAPYALAQDKPAGKGVSCKSGSDERRVEIQPREGGGCKVMYTRAAETKEIGQAAHQTEVCDHIQEKVIKKLEASGYKCG